MTVQLVCYGQSEGRSMSVIADEDLVRIVYELDMQHSPALVYEEQKDGVGILVPSSKYKALAAALDLLSRPMHAQEMLEEVTHDEVAAYDPGIAELDFADHILASRLERYIPRVDPLVEEVYGLIAEMTDIRETAERIVAAVRGCEQSVCDEKDDGGSCA